MASNVIFIVSCPLPWGEVTVPRERLLKSLAVTRRSESVTVRSDSTATQLV